MQRTRIEWVRNQDGTQGYTINPVKGLCPMACPYCYARAMYKRFKWNPEIRWEPETLIDLSVVPDNSKVFIGSTFELFHDSVIEHMPFILDCIKKAPWQTSILLTKQPQNLVKFSPFPSNVWLGVSVTSQVQLRPAIWGLTDVQCNKRFLSLEPLLENVFDQVLPAEWDDYIDWVIIGSQTKPYKPPKIEWVKEIVDACDKAHIPVFLKNNLRPLLIPEDCSKPNALMDDIFWATDKAKLRQEISI